MSLMHAWRSSRLDLPLVISPAECAGETYIVTGSNIGIGLETVRHLVAQKTTRVIMAVRSLDRGEAARQGCREFNRRHGRRSSVAFSTSHRTNRSGRSPRELSGSTGSMPWCRTRCLRRWTGKSPKDGEQSITVNIFGTMLLAVLLVPHLRKCSSQFGTTPTISFVGSGMASSVEGELRKLDRENIFEDWNNQDKFPMDIRRYVCRSFPSIRRYKPGTR